MKKVILAGHAVTANILRCYLENDPRYQVIASTVDDDFLSQDSGGTVGLSSLLALYPPSDHVIMMAMGYHALNQSRESMFYRLKEMGYTIETYIHKDAKVYTKNPVGEGSVILPSAVVEPYVDIGMNTMVWANVTLAHHSSIASHCWIASGAVISGFAKIARNCFIGVNATIVNNLSIGEYGVIGAGA